MAQLRVRQVGRYTQSQALMRLTLPASEVFVIVSLTLFLPICLEQFARDNGFLLPERTERCTASLSGPPTESTGRCVVKLGWAWIDTASFRLVYANPDA